MEAKREIRRRLRHHRRTIPGSHRRRAAYRLREESLFAVRRFQARHVACYLDADGEAPTGALITALHEAGAVLYLPALCRGTRRLAFRRYDPGTPLRPNRYGLPEPPPGHAPELPARRLDLAFVPLVAFDLGGRRLGMGGGYYDATFSFLRTHPWHPPRLLGLAFASQQVPRLPGEAWDLPLTGVMTERGYVKLPQVVARQD
ncbi:MAG: 5-formyltetrahydrofolate cyclo-ligase [Halorhodospira sp.]